ncbi:MAG: hypothetical protein EBR82_74635 [Caulobacteraceae bacterium]|nr:hypothetical protein [Caulobacteraceae bacterium]
MNTPLSSIRGAAIAHVTSEISDPQLAATIIAIDIPLHQTAPMQVVVGDGIKSRRIIWQFAGASPTGNTAQIVAKAWFDDEWIAKNSKHTLARIKRAFTAMFLMAEQSKGGMRYVEECTNADTIKTAGTAIAATMVGLDHPCLGSTQYGGSTWWHFDRAAAVDLDLWMDKEIHLKLPHSDLSYIKAALLNWKQLLSDIKSVTHTAVKHKKRTAYIGKDDDQKTILTLEKLLYRK